MDNRRKFLGAISTVGVGLLFLKPMKLLANSEDRVINFPSDDLLVNLKEVSEKYLSKQILDFELTCKHNLELKTTYTEHHKDYEELNYQSFIEKLNGEVLYLACIQQMVIGRELRESDVKKFCKVLNRLAEDNVIQEFVLAPMAAMKLGENRYMLWTEEGFKVNRMKKRALLMFHTFSKLTIKEQKQLNQSILLVKGK